MTIKLMLSEVLGVETVSLNSTGWRDEFKTTALITELVRFVDPPPEKKKLAFLPSSGPDKLKKKLLDWDGTRLPRKGSEAFRRESANDDPKYPRYLSTLDRVKISIPPPNGLSYCAENTF